MIGAPAAGRRASTFSRTPPCAVNLKALDSRFFSTCCRRFESVMMTRPRSDVDLRRRSDSLRFSASCRNGRADRLQQRAEEQLLGLHRHRAGLDLRQVEDVGDQVQQVGAGAVDGAGELHLLVGEVAVRVLGQLLAEDQDASSAACAARATCWPGTRTCTSRSAPAPPPFPPARGGPARSPGSCAPPRRSARRAAGPSAPAARWSAAARFCWVCSSAASCCDCVSSPSVCIVASMS